MNDAGKLRGLTPIGPGLDRVWRPPKKRKPGDRPKKRNDRLKHKGNEEETEEASLEGMDISIGNSGTPDQDIESVGYNAGGVRKSRKHKVDLVI
jgi:hypothetical protein